MSSRSDNFTIKGLEKMPLQIPVELLIAQKSLGITAVMTWINMALFEQQRQPVNAALIAEAMHIGEGEVSKALACLADHGWIIDNGNEIKLCVPDLKPVEPDVELLDPMQKGFEWLVNFWTNRVGVPAPEDMQRLMFWVEQKKMSHEVIAVAIEEMCNSISNPHIGYLEGILRHWLMEGVTTYQELLDKPYLAKILHQTRLEPQINPESERKWKELFPDEFDS